ncbi:hypothetical protein D0Z06_24230 [Geodermatophilus marinus]|nr:hypothetical protein D0Z06_24230 [Geodermatophilus sp. LHW52908]
MHLSLQRLERCQLNLQHSVPGCTAGPLGLVAVVDAPVGPVDERWVRISRSRSIAIRLCSGLVTEVILPPGAGMPS